MLWIWRCPFNCEQNNMVCDFEDPCENEFGDFAPEDFAPCAPKDDLCKHDGLWARIENDFLII